MIPPTRPRAYPLVPRRLGRGDASAHCEGREELFARGGRTPRGAQAAQGSCPPKRIRLTPPVHTSSVTLGACAATTLGPVPTFCAASQFEIMAGGKSQGGPLGNARLLDATEVDSIA